MLRAFGFAVEGDTVRVPSWRGDVEHYSDLAEEVARLYGYNNIPTTLMRGGTTQGGLSETQRAARDLGVLCRGMGFSEIMTYSFVSPSSYARIGMPEGDARRASVTILNPLGEDTSIMRTTSLPSMLETLARNYSYRNKAARLYEMATVYPPRDNGPLADEKPVLTLGAYGDGEDFFRLKGAVEAILTNMNVKEVSFAAERANEAYHPGRCAAVLAKGTRIGTIGQVHPLVAEGYGVDVRLYTAELDVFALMALRAPEAVYRPLPRYPAVSRDIAVVCGAEIPVAELESCIARGGGALLREISLFDVYTGAPIPEGKKSVAFSSPAVGRPHPDGCRGGRGGARVLEFLKTSSGPGCAESGEPGRLRRSSPNAPFLPKKPAGLFRQFRGNVTVFFKFSRGLYIGGRLG
jgi:phenylalanyl-tRNA synthetase beta chain